MTTIYSRYCLLLAGVVVIAGCGKQERVEAVQFAKALNAKKATFAEANAAERELISTARAWCAGITGKGAGRGAELDKNSAKATELAKAAVAVSAKLSEVRGVIDDLSLKEDFTRNVRAELTTQLTKRQRLLQDFRALLEQAAPQFLEYKQSKAYTGDSYPDGVSKLDAQLGSYRVPEEAIGTALTALQTNYKLADNEF